MIKDRLLTAADCSRILSGLAFQGGLEGGLTDAADFPALVILILIFLRRQDSSTKEMVDGACGFVRTVCTNTSDAYQVHMAATALAWLYLELVEREKTDSNIINILLTIWVIWNRGNQVLPDCLHNVGEFSRTLVSLGGVRLVVDLFSPFRNDAAARYDSPGTVGILHMMVQRPANRHELLQRIAAGDGHRIAYALLGSLTRSGGDAQTEREQMWALHVLTTLAHEPNGRAALLTIQSEGSLLRRLLNCLLSKTVFARTHRSAMAESVGSLCSREIVRVVTEELTFRLDGGARTCISFYCTEIPEGVHTLGEAEALLACCVPCPTTPFAPEEYSHTDLAKIGAIRALVLTFAREPLDLEYPGSGLLATAIRRLIDGPEMANTLGYIKLASDAGLDTRHLVSLACKSLSEGGAQRRALDALPADDNLTPPQAAQRQRTLLSFLTRMVSDPENARTIISWLHDDVPHAVWKRLVDCDKRHRINCEDPDTHPEHVLAHRLLALAIGTLMEAQDRRNTPGASCRACLSLDRGVCGTSAECALGLCCGGVEVAPHGGFLCLRDTYVLYSDPDTENEENHSFDKGDVLCQRCYDETMENGGYEDFKEQDFGRYVGNGQILSEYSYIEPPCALRARKREDMMVVKREGSHPDRGSGYNYYHDHWPIDALEGALSALTSTERLWLQSGSDEVRGFHSLDGGEGSYCPHLANGTIVLPLEEALLIVRGMATSEAGLYFTFMLGEPGDGARSLPAVLARILSCAYARATDKLERDAGEPEACVELLWIRRTLAILHDLVDPTNTNRSTEIVHRLASEPSLLSSLRLFSKVRFPATVIRQGELGTATLYGGKRGPSIIEAAARIHACLAGIVSMTRTMAKWVKKMKAEAEERPEEVASPGLSNLWTEAGTNKRQRQRR